MPGGPGDKDSAGFALDNWLAQGYADFRVVILYALDNDLTDEFDRVVGVRDQLRQPARGPRRV